MKEKEWFRKRTFSESGKKEPWMGTDIVKFVGKKMAGLLE